MQNELVKVTTNEQGQQLVSGRELHEVLSIQQDFSDWVKKQLSNVDAVENEDFTIVWHDPFKKVVKFNGNVNSMTRQGYSQEYILTLDIAKEICMCVGVAPRTNEEAKKLSKQVRKYFIECEKKYKEQKQPKLTPMQECALTIFNEEVDGVERILALETFKKLSIQEGVKVGYSQGLKQLCKDGIVTIPEIMNYIHELYADKFAYVSDIVSTEWSRYLKHMGYLHTVHFKRKNGFGMEDKPVYQPTKMFEDVFVEQGMAIIREIDNRGKVEIKYTVELDKFLKTESFVETFFSFLDSKYNKFGKSIISEESNA